MAEQQPRWSIKLESSRQSVPAPVLKMTVLIDAAGDIATFAFEVIEGANPMSVAIAGYQIGLKTEFPK